MAARRFAMTMVLAAGCALFAGCSERPGEQTAAQNEPAASPDQGKIFLLPKGLREISGLAAASATSIYAHNDEYGIIYEISVTDGAILKAFALGRPTFEGIAVLDKHIYLMTSNGRIFEAPVSAHGARAVFNVYDTGLSDKCEFEGLATGAAPGDFLLLCKRSAPELPVAAINIYRWSIEDRRQPAAPWASIPLSSFLTEDEARTFQPSAIERRAADGVLIIVSATNAMMVEVTQAGALVSKKALGVSAHPQAEGLALLPSGAVVIADEGARRGPGRITVYSRRGP